MNENFATKADFKELGWELRSEMSSMENRLESKIQALSSDIKAMEYKLTIKLGTMMAISIGVTATLIKMMSIN